MATTYTEFDSTIGTLIKDLRGAILLNTDWSWSASSTVQASTSAASVAGATTLTFTSGTIPANVAVGTVLRIDNYTGDFEYRVVTVKTATVLTFGNALSFAHPSGTPIFFGNEVFKATTTRGADMIFDLTGGGSTTNRLLINVLNGWTAATTTTPGVYTGGYVSKFLYHRQAGGTSTTPVHVVLSTSKDHIYFSIEGSRYNEPAATSTTYGTVKNNFFMTDLVPYSTTDTIPAVVAGGSNVETINASLTNKSHNIHVSKSLNGAQMWTEGKLMTLTVPLSDLGTANVQRYTPADDEIYLSPYVVVTDVDGFRGRLSNLFNAGWNYNTVADGTYPLLGSNVVYGGTTYEMQAVNKGDGTNQSWGPLGSATNTGTSFYQSVVVAIPIA